MTPDVSVIIPTYNRAAMLHEAIASVLAQQDVRLELIVVDDGSTDGSCDDLASLIETARGAAQVTFRLVRNIRNRGVAAARNAGVANATAPLIAFLDSDDLWAPTKLRRQIDFMRASSGCQIAQTEEIWIRDGRRVNPGRRHEKRAGDIFVASLRTCLISPSAVMMRTELFTALRGFDEQMIAAEDYDLWLRILRHHQVGLIEEPLVTRRAGHPGQLSATVPAIDRFRILALLKLLAGIDLSRERRVAIGEVLTEKCGVFAQGLKRRGDEAAAGFIRDVADHTGTWVSGPNAGLEQAISGLRAMLGPTQVPDADREPIELEAR
jgi:glycosyltransferase involved in cell wall biosynthesis